VGEARASYEQLHGEGVDLAPVPVEVERFIRARLDGAPLGHRASPSELDALLDGSITAGGLGPAEAWRRVTEVIVPNTIGLDSERFLAFIPMAPSAAAVWMDAVVGAASFSAESWLEAAGAVAAEHQLVRFLADLAGLPPGAGGCCMSGGSIGNLSALAVAREHRPGRPLVAVADTVHASVDNALHLLGLTALVVPTGPDGRFTGEGLAAAVGERTGVGVVVASGGSTNAGIVDDLAGVAEVAQRMGAWLHVDAAYGGAALLLDELRPRFAGVEHADSIIVDPHKWLFATSGSCAVIYREPALAAAVHTQHGPYLDVLHGDDERDWNPCDLGYQLTRRASGLPLWFSLAVHGSDAHAAAVRRGVALARYTADAIRGLGAPLEMVIEPELSVVLFRRHGWDATDWRRWAAGLLDAGVAFVAPTSWRGEPVGRLVFLHPRTPTSLIDEILSTLT
jgi:glutamate/tyrosine decarboxylase-like PLP-dependent enzyme